ncbi:MAG TPA: HAMP domain-containing sensor histidine kinase [Longimicrobiaceae bacterium]|nr:HAMP domain-containing sensor histidine kinase [Longimicrobiaceae bacterium]
MSAPLAAPAGERRRWLLPALNLSVVVVISVLDRMTPAGVVVGMLASIPIVLASFTDSRAVVWLTFHVAVAGFITAALYGTGPTTSPLVWVPNRIFAFVTLPASCGVALMLQRRRMEAVRARDAAMASSELNRLLTALLAHDLRTPLLLASQGLAYVQDAVGSGRRPDAEILAALGARLQRSLRAIDATLAMARPEPAAPHPREPAGPHPPVQVAREIEEEVASFAEEALARRKTLESGVDGLAGRRFRVDARVLRQGLGVLIDNSIRHAAPGTIRVSAEVLPSSLGVRVEDDGTPAPGVLREAGPAPSEGAGLGLDLCRALAAHAGGSLEVERCGPDGTSFVLRLPAVPVGDRE